MSCAAKGQGDVANSIGGYDGRQGSAEKVFVIDCCVENRPSSGVRNGEARKGGQVVLPGQTCIGGR